MGLSTNKFVPPPPPSGPMEERSTKSLLYLSNQENRASTQKLDNALSPFLPPKLLTDATGRKFLVLGRQAGTDDVATACPFGGFYSKLVGEVFHGVFYGGIVSGSTATIIVPENDFGPLSGVSGRYVWLQVNMTARVVDGILCPGGDPTSASMHSGTSIPSSTLPAWNAPTGQLILHLGQFTTPETDVDPIFVSNGCGNFTVGHCGGIWTSTR